MDNLLPDKITVEYGNVDPFNEIKLDDYIVDGACSGNNVFFVTKKGDFGSFGLANSDLGYETTGMSRAETITPFIRRLELKRKAVSVFAGSNQGFIIDCKQNVWAWGHNYYGQLGVGRRFGDVLENPILIPIPFKIIQVASGNRHTMFLTEEGVVFGCGSNLDGQLQFENSSLKRERIYFPTIICKNILKISAGSNHSVLLNKAGEVIVAGRCDDGQTGISTSQFKIDDKGFEYVDNTKISNDALIATTVWRDEEDVDHLLGQKVNLSNLKKKDIFACGSFTILELE